MHDVTGALSTRVPPSLTTLSSSTLEEHNVEDKIGGTSIISFPKAHIRVGYILVSAFKWHGFADEAAEREGH
jgi:hypothetical protein